MSLLKAMATVGGLTGLSRLAGFARDIMTAAVLGAGPIADAFFVALKLPNFFRRITAEGAFSVSFVPLYTEAMEKQGEKKANDFAGNAMGVMFWILLVFTILVIVFMPQVIMLIAPGFHDDPQRFHLAVTLSRITFPYLLAMSLAALLGGVLNAHGKFAPFAAAPILFNLSLIGLLLFAYYFKTPGHALAFGVLTAGVLQFGALWFVTKRMKITIRLHKPEIDARIRKLFKLMGPGVLGAGVMQINLFTDMIIGSLLPTGTISYLYYADRLNQLPLGMIGIAVGTALLPMLSRAVAAENTRESRNLFNRALEICLFLGLPAATGLFIISYPIVRTLFEHGAFGHDAAVMTAAVITTYALGIPPYVVAKVYSTAYYAQQDTLTPVKCSIASALFNIGVALWLVLKMHVGVVGIAAATSIAGWLQIILLAWGMRKHKDVRFDKRFRKNFLKIALSCVLMGAFLYPAKNALHPLYIGNDSFISHVIALGILIGGGAAVYGLSVILTGVIKPTDFKKLLVKGRA